MTALSRLLWNFLAGPRIYSIYSAPQPMYPCNSLESLGDFMLSFLKGTANICLAVSPVLLLVAFNRSLLTTPNIVSFAKFISVYYVVALGARALGRINNREYRKFVRVLLRANEEGTTDARLHAQLADYDYQIFAAPLDFKARKLERRMINPSAEDLPPDAGPMLGPIRDLLAYIFVHTFGRRLVYPGGVALFNMIVANYVIDARRKLIVEKGGQRAVLLAQDGNLIDTMFVDRRGKEDCGNTLVVTCEGNAGYYETGIMVTPLSLGYSVLGWNHPGFAESSGQPLPSQILNAVDAVMQYAVERLGFREDDIIIYAWSIGGFPGTWAAANYPDIKGLILDATFDDLLPLAEARMPKSFGALVKHAVRTHLNLPIAKQLALYNGPVLLIRRSQDEMIITVEVGTDEERRASNRANDLLKSLLRSRHPGLIDGFEVYVDEWLAADVVERLAITPTHQVPIREPFDELTEHDRAQLIFSLCSHYLVDFDSTHNMPLEPALFNVPTIL
uniref:AB hydrolase-1 domain-containing protein n=1 Tax=Ascaris lumbricoides TaxID=6252 RepID=A0A0M3HT41_ASCLU